MNANRASTAPEQDFQVRADGMSLPGQLTVPEGATGVVVFAHGSGSSRLSPRNLRVARTLQRAGLGTLLFDLLTEHEAGQRERVFDIPLLGRRLVTASSELRGLPELSAHALGYFGASTGAAASLWAAAELGDAVSAVVSRGGRPDLAGDRLSRVSAPTLLLVGGEDPLVLEMNREAQRGLHCENDLVIVPGAGHLFEEPGTLDTVADQASSWFARHLA